VAPAVGVELHGLEELERRKRHVVELVLHGLRGLTSPATATSTLSETESHD
jgi:hypothetical protein